MNVFHERERIYFENEKHEIIAYVTFPFVNEHQVGIEYIFVDDYYRGFGLADKLMTELIRHLENENLTAFASCTYAKKWLYKHSEYDCYLKESILKALE